MKSCDPAILEHEQLFRKMAVAIVVVSFVLSIQVPFSVAQELAYSVNSSTEIRDSNGKSLGREIYCKCVTANDRIAVYRVEGTTPISPGLDQEADFEGSIWLFDVGDRGSYQIAAHFYRADGLLTADLYQDQDGDGQVSLRSPSSDMKITEPGWWSVQVTALDGYWQRNGRLAANFDLFVDDRFRATFGAERFIDKMANDGLVDVVIHVRGPRGDDPRSYDWRNVYTPVPSSSGIARTNLMVREQGLEPAFPPSFPWYLLGPAIGIVKPYGESFAPIQVDWELGKLAVIGEFVASRGSDVNWFTYSLSRVEPGAITDPNFESPFNFYDLANDMDSLPELQIRVDRFGPDDPYNSAPAAWRGRPYQQIRYSWDQTNTQYWSYKIGLLGQHTIDGEVVFPEFTLQTIPYGELPTWVTERTWDIATFVAAEEPLWTSEGLYDLDPAGILRDGYYAGITNSSAGFGNTMEKGRRGEYSLDFNDQPWLYFSLIDRQLHLESADSGVWNIDGHREVRYLNDAGGATFDGWQRWEYGKLTAQLYRIPGGLLYSDAMGTFIVEAEILDQLVRTLPPTTHDEWTTLGQQLQTNGREFEQGDLRAMFDQFGGATQLSTGPISGFTRTADAFSFEVRVDDSETRDALSATTGAPVMDGVQIVTRAGERWTAAPAAFISPTVAISVEPGNNLSTVPVHVTIVNPGALELSDATITIQAVAANGQIGAFLGSDDVMVTGGGEQPFVFSWAPGQSGTWIIDATITRETPDARTGGQVTLLQTVQTIQVPQAGVFDPSAAGRLGWAGSQVGRMALFLSLLMFTGLAAGVVLWRGLRLR